MSKLQQSIKTSKEEISKISNVANLVFDENEFLKISNYFFQLYKLNKLHKNQIDNFHIYVGEFFIKYIGNGIWKKNTIKKDPAYNRFCIVDWADGAARFDPFFAIMEFFNQENSLFLLESIKKTKNNIIELNNSFKRIGL